MLKICPKYDVLSDGFLSFSPHREATEWLECVALETYGVSLTNYSLGHLPPNPWH